MTYPINFADMKKLISFLAIMLPVIAFTQVNTVQNASIAKDVQVDVTVTDFKEKALPHEIMIFRSKRNQREYQGLTDDGGKFSVRLPAGDQYEIYILGFKDSTSYDVMDVPDPGPNASYKKPFTLSFQFQPSKIFVLEDCNFETGKATLEPESYQVIDELLAYLNRKVDDRIEIGGHTDNVGTAAANLVLSKDRAISVMNYLISKGVDPSRLEAKGYGMTMPVETNKTEEGRAQNRRTEIKIL
ncbi:MAG: OmpA family protein [Chitinophagaceae bacterium]|nr:MAG: OmpA family protein [Chitinophagaceae bacterium]